MDTKRTHSRGTDWLPWDMNPTTLKLSTLFTALTLAAGVALAQTAAPVAATSPAKKELVAKLLRLQQPGIEAMARNLAEQPAAQLLNQAGLAMQTRVAPEKREAMAKEIGADVKKYADEALPLVRDRAVKLAPGTVGKLLEDKFTEDELRQIVAMLESPAYAKYMQLSDEMQNALLEKLVTETRPTIEPKIKALEASIGKRLGLTPTAARPSAPAK